MHLPKKKLWVIINPVSGTKSKKNIPLQIESILGNQYDIQIIMTQYPGHASEIAEQAINEGVNVVLAVGGDGTVNEIGKSLVGSEVVLAILPVGSGNGLARSLHIPMNIVKAIEVLTNGKVKDIDYGTANGHIFLCTCGVGYDAYVSEKALNQKKRGKLMYTKNMVNVFASYKPEEFRIKTSEVDIAHKAFVVTCANAPQYGNDAFIAPNASMEDGLMHITLLLPIKKRNLPKIATQMFTNNLTNNKKMIEVISSEVTIYRQNDGVMHLDGNAIYEGKEINIKINNKGLKVLVPLTYSESLTKGQKLMKNMTKWI